MDTCEVFRLSVKPKVFGVGNTMSELPSALPMVIAARAHRSKRVVDPEFNLLLTIPKKGSRSSC